ncbi:MAG: hypothetical protein IJ660_02440 [Alphaproteobacteria bacterium]|nr:hypothetical protein [Alphaproteobacteria bacterium]
MKKKIEKFLLKDGVLLTKERMKIVLIFFIGFMMGWIVMDIIRAIIRLYF